MKKSLWALVPMGLGVSFYALASGDPSSVKFKVYGVAISTSADCSDPQVVFSSDTATEVDFAAGPTLGVSGMGSAAEPSDGTYNCVMITMSDHVKVTPMATDGACVAGHEFEDGVCQESESTNLLTGTAFGAATSCTAGEDKVTLYLTTGSTRTRGGGGAFLKPTSTSDPDHGLALSAPWVISGPSVGTFVVDFTGAIMTDGTSCGIEPPRFGFR